MPSICFRPALIGRNETGLTLTKEAINAVLDQVHQFFDQASTEWRVKKAKKMTAQGIVAKVLPVLDVVISDLNKPFVLEHSSAIDDLVAGLLLDDGNPRRSQDGACSLRTRLASSGAMAITMASKRSTVPAGRWGVSYETAAAAPSA